jgi:IS30 family transposase
MKVNKPLTFEERQEIEKYLKLGLNCGKISQLLQRSRTGIRQEILLSPKPYDAVTAQKRSESVRNFKNKNISTALKGNKNKHSYIYLQE